MNDVDVDNKFSLSLLSKGTYRVLFHSEHIVNI